MPENEELPRNPLPGLLRGGKGNLSMEKEEGIQPNPQTVPGFFLPRFSLDSSRLLFSEHLDFFFNFYFFFYFCAGFAEESREPIRAGGLRELRKD